MIRRYGPWLAGAAALAIAACLDMSAPKSGVSSISALLLPSPSVVVQDVMRDSLGAPAPLRIIAYDVTGQPVNGLTPEFFVLDRIAHVDAAGFFFGDSLTTVRVVGSVVGLQTLPVPVPITLSPDSMARSGTTDSLLIGGPDSSQNLSNPLDVSVLHTIGLTGVQGVVVHYRVLYMPPALAGKPPTAYIGDESARPSPNDTTDTGGRASRRAVIRGLSIGNLPDSIVVEASAQYKGVALRGAPRRFVVRVPKPGG